MVKPSKGGYKRFAPGIKEKAFELLRAGNTGKAVAKQLGVSYPTIINWKRSSSPGETPVPQGRATDAELQLLRLENDYLKKRMETDGEVDRLRLEVEYLRKRLTVYEG